MLTGTALWIALIPALGPIDRYGGAPSVADGAGIALKTEMVKIAIGKRDAAVEARYVFKNLTAKEIKTTLRLPLIATDSPLPPAANLFPEFMATWDNAPATWTLSAGPQVGGSEVFSYEKSYFIPVLLKPSATHVLRCSYRTSLGKADLARYVAYRTGGARSFEGRVERADLSYTYAPDTVFEILAFTPAWKWAWGTTGAYCMRQDFEPAEGETMSMVFYPADLR